MSDGVKETPCTHCAHRTVCKHKAVNEATVHEHENGNRIKMTKVINYDCISDISVTCRYHQPEVAISREGIF